MNRLRLWFWLKFRTKSIRDYGAYGDGIHDDTAAIQAAVDAAGRSRWFRGRRLHKGTFVVTRPIKFPPRTRLFGEGTDQ